MFHDEYERVNFWSHAVPGVLFLVLGALALQGIVPGALPLFVYTCCTGTTHLTSAATHVYPDSHLLVSLRVAGREPCMCPSGHRSVAWLVRILRLSTPGDLALGSAVYTLQ